MPDENRVFVVCRGGPEDGNMYMINPPPEFSPAPWHLAYVKDGEDLGTYEFEGPDHVFEDALAFAWKPKMPDFKPKPPTMIFSERLIEEIRAAGVDEERVNEIVNSEYTIIVPSGRMPGKATLRSLIDKAFKEAEQAKRRENGQEAEDG